MLFDNPFPHEKRDEVFRVQIVCLYLSSDLEESIQLGDASVHVDVLCF